MAKLILTPEDSSSTFSLSAGPDWTVIGSSSPDQIVLAAGTTAHLLLGATGDDVVTFLGSSSDYVVSRLGSQAIFTHVTTGSSTYISASGEADRIIFDPNPSITGDELSLNLFISSQGVQLGSQIITTATAEIGATATATYELAASAAAVDEGDSVVLTLTTTNVTTGTEVDVIFGGTANTTDVAGGLPTMFTVGADGTASLMLHLAADAMTEGVETLIASVQGETTTITINDTSVSPVTEPTLLEQADAESAVNATVGELLSLTDAQVTWLVDSSSTFWNQDTLTYGFLSTMPTDYASDPDLYTGWRQVSTEGRALISAFLNSLESYIDLTFNFASSASMADMRVSTNIQQGSAGFAYYPGTGIGGDVFLSSVYDLGAAITPLDYFHETFVHEFGHALGLKHPFSEPNTAPTAYDNAYYSIMSYTGAPRLIPDFAFSSNNNRESVSSEWSYVYRDDYALLDIAALQALYGYSTATTADDTYTFTAPGQTSWAYRTLWDAGGTDTLDFSSLTASVLFTLNPGELSSVGFMSLEEQIDATLDWYTEQGSVSDWSEWVTSVYTSNQGDLYTGEDNFALAYGTIIENIITGAGDDTITDNYVDNLISTGAGDDVITVGAGGFDSINGGSGNDTLMIPVASAQCASGWEDGYFYCITDNFSVQLQGIEQIQFTDQVVALT